MAALLTSDQENTDRVAIEIEECRNMGIEVLPPDINQSFESFTVVTSGTDKNKVVDENEKVDTIRFGLKAIKNVGGHIAEEIISERKKNGPYKDISDLLERVNDKDLNKKSLESLVKSGGLDNFAERGQILGNMENILKFNKELSQSKNNGQSSLFADSPSLNMKNRIRLEYAPEADRQEKLRWEKELMGLYISEHPFSDFKKYLENIIIPLANLKEHSKKDKINTAGVITKIKKIQTRSNESMLFVKIEDSSTNIEVLVFPKMLKESADVWQDGKTVLCQGKISDKDQEVKLLCNKVIELTLDNVEQTVIKFVKSNGVSYGQKVNDTCVYFNGENFYIKFKKNYDNITLEKLKNILISNKGEKKVYFRVNTSNMETEFKITHNNYLEDEINNLLK